MIYNNNGNNDDYNLNSINMSYAIHIFLENDYDVICGVIMMSARGHFSL